MSENPETSPPPGGQFLVYQAEDGKLKIDVRMEGETVWLTQQQLAELFQTSKQNVGQHLKKIFEEGELGEISVVKNFFTTAADGKRYGTNFYNLDAIIEHPPSPRFRWEIRTHNMDRRSEAGLDLMQFSYPKFSDNCRQWERSTA